MWDILAVIVGVILTAFTGLIALYVNGLNARLCKTEEKAENNGKEIIRLSGKLWSEEKLEKAIQNAVNASFLKWENKMLKNGQKR